MTNDFGFKVRRVKAGVYFKSAEPGWVVSLPHQCDAWEIAGSNYGPATKEAAIRDLKLFIAEAQQALETLEEEHTQNLTEYEVQLDKE